MELYHPQLHVSKQIREAWTAFYGLSAEGGGISLNRAVTGV